MGERGVVEASFSAELEREAFRDVADRTSSRRLEVRCQPPDAVLKASTGGGRQRGCRLTWLRRS
jgi:predicted kinase